MVLIVPTHEELDSISLACNKLWELDTNRLVPDVDYRLNLQHATRVGSRTDSAADPLFMGVREDVFQR